MLCYIRVLTQEKADSKTHKYVLRILWTLGRENFVVLLWALAEVVQRHRPMRTRTILLGQSLATTETYLICLCSGNTLIELQPLYRWKWNPCFSLNISKLIATLPLCIMSLFLQLTEAQRSRIVEVYVHTYRRTYRSHHQLANRIRVLRPVYMRRFMMCTLPQQTIFCWADINLV